MSGMLASITSVDEARRVLQAGVDIIDMKNPSQGALGALGINTVKDIVQSVKQNKLTSATIGDIRSNSPNLLSRIIEMGSTGVDYVKVGLFAEEPSDFFIKNISDAAEKHIKVIIVLFAENYIDTSPVLALLKTGISGIMLDTKNKNTENLCAILTHEQLAAFTRITKDKHLISGLAGSLTYESIPKLLELNPDYLGFRGALCKQQSRINSISDEQVSKVRKAIPATTRQFIRHKAIPKKTDQEAL